MSIPVPIVLGLIELAKTGLQAFFSAMRLAGKSSEEIDEMYQAEKAYFEAHPPDTLPEVPE